MKKLLFLFSILCLIGLKGIAGSIMTIPSGETALKLIIIKNQWWLVTDKNLYKKDKNNLDKVNLLKTDNRINSAVVLNDTIWLGTSDGLFSFDPREHGFNNLHLDSSSVADDITGLACDSEKHLWVTTFNKGVYQREKKEFKKVLDVVPVHSIGSTPNGNLWIGTDIGLYRYSLKENTWTRYAEEGVSGNGGEIPDNIVENIFCTDLSNTWVVMPEYFTMIPDDTKHAEHYSFGGRELNGIEEIYSIEEVESESYLFFTSKGVLLLPRQALEKKITSNEVHASDNQKLVLLNSKKLEQGLSINEPVLFISKIPDGNYWAVTTKNIFFLKKKYLKSFINNSQISN